MDKDQLKEFTNTYSYAELQSNPADRLGKLTKAVCYSTKCQKSDRGTIKTTRNDTCSDCGDYVRWEKYE